MAAPISPEIRVYLRAIDELSGTLNTNTEAVQQLTNAISGAGKTTEAFGKSQMDTRMTMRGVALDLRMISIATAIFRRELGDTNPVLSGLAQGLLMVSTGLTATFAAADLMWRASQMLATGFLTATHSVHLFGIAITTSLATVGIVIFAIVAAAAAIMWLVQAWSPATRAAEYFAGRMTYLKEQVEDAKVAIEGLRLEMEGLTTQQEILRLETMKLEHVQRERGYLTETEIATMAALESNQERLTLGVQEYRTQVAMAEYTTNKWQQQLDAINRYIASLPQYGLDPFFSHGINDTDVFTTPAPPPYGQMGFPPTATVSPKGLETAGVRSRAINVTITLPGAVISSNVDLIEALAQGGEQAANEVRRRL
jgi:hypothetical protein